MHCEGNPLACACGMRGPKPYGEVPFFSVARGPVPRDVERFMKHPQLYTLNYTTLILIKIKKIKKFDKIRIL